MQNWTRNILNELYSAELFLTKYLWTSFDCPCFDLVLITLGLITRDTQIHSFVMFSCNIESSQKLYGFSVKWNVSSFASEHIQLLDLEISVARI